MLIRPVGITNFLGDFTNKGVPIDKERQELFHQIAENDDVDIYISRDAGPVFEKDKMAYTIQTSKKFKRPAEAWESSTLTLNSYETIKVSKFANKKAVSNRLQGSVFELMGKLGKRVAEETGKDPKYLAFLKK